MTINFYIFLIALVLALLEIQIEGKEGWASNLPVWRPGWKFLSKEITGYHGLLILLLLLFFHFPFVSGGGWSLSSELKILSLFFIFVSVWDFLWFVLNPHFPLKKFKAEHIWWHKNWLLGLPTDYYGSLVISLIVLLPLFISGDAGVFSWWAKNIAQFLVETVLVIAFSLYILKIDNWKIKS